MKVASRKAKGRKFQQLIRDKLIDLLKPFQVEPADVKSTSMGAGGEDITLSSFARGLLPISVECKSNKSMAVYNWYEQCKSNAGEFEPAVFIKVNNKKPLTVIDTDYYLYLETMRIKYELET